MTRTPLNRQSGRGQWWRRLAWFVALWLGGVLMLGAVGGLIKLVL